MDKLDAQLIHDMRNAVTVLQEGADQLKHGVQTLPPDAVEHLCSMIARRSEMLVKLLDDLGCSDLADRGALNLSVQRVSIADACGEALAGRPLPKGVSVSVDVPADLTVLADPFRLAQVVDNLLGNALRYGGPRIRVAAAHVSGTVELSVSDDGAGVPEALRDSLFEGYSSGSESRTHGGSGLGLLIVRQLAESMSGSVAYHHRTDHGPRFTLTLPALPVARRPLHADQAEHGHSVMFWTDDGSGTDPVVGSIASYAAHGLTRGEAVVMAACPRRLERVDSALSALGIDLAAAVHSGQYTTIDAEALDEALVHDGHVDPARFQHLVGDRLHDLHERWSSLRVYGEVVDRYWRRGDAHLALELEAAWGDLRTRVDFALMCAYELAPGLASELIHTCHDAAVTPVVDAA